MFDFLKLIVVKIVDRTLALSFVVHEAGRSGHKLSALQVHSSFFVLHVLVVNALLQAFNNKTAIEFIALLVEPLQEALFFFASQGSAKAQSCGKHAT